MLSSIAESNIVKPWSDTCRHDVVGCVSHNQTDPTASIIIDIDLQ